MMCPQHTGSHASAAVALRCMHRLDLAVVRIELFKGATSHQVSAFPSGPEGNLWRSQRIKIQRVYALWG
jgi:hypothetical protein